MKTSIQAILEKKKKKIQQKAFRTFELRTNIYIWADWSGDSFFIIHSSRWGLCDPRCYFCVWCVYVCVFESMPSCCPRLVTGGVFIISTQSFLVKLHQERMKGWTITGKQLWIHSTPIRATDRLVVEKFWSYWWRNGELVREEWECFTYFTTCSCVPVLIVFLLLSSHLATLHSHPFFSLWYSVEKEYAIRGGIIQYIHQW